MAWPVGEAKQKLSELLRRSTTEPQLIRSRGRLVAVVISADLFKEFQRWREERQNQTLGQRFDEVREICRQEDYTLDVGPRKDRESWTTDEEECSSTPTS